MKRFAILALLASSVASFESCAQKPSVKLVLLDPCKSFRSAATYAEFAVFKNSCPSDQQLAAGDTTGAVYRAVRPAQDALPTVGNLSKNKYGFAILLRDDQCGVIGFGCTPADLNTIREIRIEVQAWTNPASSVCTPLKGTGCQAPTSCVAGRCVSEGGTGQCNLSLVASGALPAPDVAAPQVTGPAVAATSSGFVVAYREQSTSNDTLKAVGLSLSDGGQLGTASEQNLTGCASIPAIDGVGLAFPFQGGDGLMALSLQDCPTSGGAGAFFVPVKTTGELGGPVKAVNPNYTDVELATIHALAATPTQGQYSFAFRVKDPSNEVELGTLENNQFKQGAALISKLKGHSADFLMVATSPRVQALLGHDLDFSKVFLQVNYASGAADGGPDAPLDQGGTPDSGGPDASVFEAGGPEAGASETGVPETGVPETGVPDGGVPSGYPLPDSPWGAIAAWDDRAAAIVPGQVVPSTTLTLKVASPIQDLGGGSIGGQFLGADIAALRDHLFIAGASADNLTLFRFDGAQTQISTTPVTTAPYQGTLGKVSLQSFDGSHVAIAAARNRVAVVWLSRLQPQSGDPAGGWALFQCDQ